MKGSWCTRKIKMYNKQLANFDFSQRSSVVFCLHDETTNSLRYNVLSMQNQVADRRSSFSASLQEWRDKWLKAVADHTYQKSRRSNSSIILFDGKLGCIISGLSSSTAPVLATKSPRMRCASVACSPGVATFSQQRTELPCQDSCSKVKLLRGPHSLFLADLWIPTIERSPFVHQLMESYQVQGQPSHTGKLIIS